MQYCPSDKQTAGVVYFGPLTVYDGATQSVGWISEFLANFETGKAYCTGDDTIQVDLVYDDWTELRLEVDLDAQEADFYYDNVFLATQPAPSIAGVDIWPSGEIVAIYYDDFRFEAVEPVSSLIASVDRSNGTSGDRGFIGVFDGETDPIPMEAGGLMDGAPVFSDRDYTWVDVPAEYVGSEYISTFNTDKDSATAPDVTYEVTISQPAFVWITIDDDITTAPHQDLADLATAAFADPGTFVDTGIDLVVRQNPDGSWDRSTNVFGAELPAGTYVFGQTAIPGSASFYIIGASPLPEPVLLFDLDA
jgi:hypothetical protein